MKHKYTIDLYTCAARPDGAGSIEITMSEKDFQRHVKEYKKNGFPDFYCSLFWQWYGDAINEATMLEDGTYMDVDVDYPWEYIEEIEAAANK